MKKLEDLVSTVEYARNSEKVTDNLFRMREILLNVLADVSWYIKCEEQREEKDVELIHSAYETTVTGLLQNIETKKELIKALEWKLRQPR